MLEEEEVRVAERMRAGTRPTTKTVMKVTILGIPDRAQIPTGRKRGWSFGAKCTLRRGYDNYAVGYWFCVDGMMEHELCLRHDTSVLIEFMLHVRGQDRGKLLYKFNPKFDTIRMV
jgi:hypothetical protein